MSEIDFANFDALTFDCYGTLIDWENGILNALQPILAPHAIEAAEADLLAIYARHEAVLESGDYLLYRQVLERSLAGICADLGFSATDEERAEFARSVGVWPAFHDTAIALGRLADRWKLGIITNCDDDLFALSNRRLGVTFDWIITAQQARSYKPDRHNFALAIDIIGVDPARMLHVAQSLYHDHVPAKQLAMTTVWVDRRRGKTGFGATPEASAVPDLVVPDMETFANLALG